MAPAPLNCPSPEPSLPHLVRAPPEESELLHLGVGDVDVPRGAGGDALRDLKLPIPGALASPFLGEANRG